MSKPSKWENSLSYSSYGIHNPTKLFNIYIENKCIKKIQSLVRGFLGRRLYDKLLRQRIMEVHNIYIYIYITGRGAGAREDGGANQEMGKGPRADRKSSLGRSLDIGSPGSLTYTKALAWILYKTQVP